MHPLKFAIAAPLLGALALAAAASAAEAVSYQVSETFHVGGAGGWDYLTVDAARHLLYVPRSTHTQVLDERTGAVVADIPGQKRNHGVALVPAVGRGFITDGADASVTVFDLKTNAVLGKIKAAEDADGIIYDAASNKVALVCGDAGVLVTLSPDLDPKTGGADHTIELGGKPEFLAADGRGKVYVNLVDQAQVAVVDLKTGTVAAHWSVAPGGTPVGMAIDPEHRLLFIGCRQPQKMIVMSCDTGNVVADLPIGRGVDAVAFDAGYALASCGDGTLAVVARAADGKYQVVQTVRTRPGARTEGVDPDTHTLYLPTAEYLPSTGAGRPQAKPGSFMVLKVSRSR